MINKASSVKPAGKILMISLIAANIFMLITGIITVLPNIAKGKAKSGSPDDISPGRPSGNTSAMDIFSRDRAGDLFDWEDTGEGDKESKDPKDKADGNFEKDITDPDGKAKEKTENPDSDKEKDKGSGEEKDSDKDSKGSKDKGSVNKKTNYSTQNRPELEDFFWYNTDMPDKSIPAGASPVNDPDPLIGGWKALIIYDPDNRFESNAVELLNIDFNASKKDISLTLDWYLMFWAEDSGAYDETDMDDSVFIGKWENGGLWASGPGTIRLTKFYELDSKQYAIGTVDTPDGLPALIALVRP